MKIKDVLARYGLSIPGMLGLAGLEIMVKWYLSIPATAVLTFLLNLTSLDFILCLAIAVLMVYFTIVILLVRTMYHEEPQEEGTECY